MFSQRFGIPAIPREDLASLRYFFSHGDLSQGSSLVDRICSASALESGVHVLSFLGHRAVGEGDLFTAYNAYSEAHYRAKCTGVFGPISLLGLLCDSVQLRDVAVHPRFARQKKSERVELGGALKCAAKSGPESVTPELLIKLLIAAGEVGATFELNRDIEQFLVRAGRDCVCRESLTGFMYILRGSAQLEQGCYVAPQSYEKAQEAFHRAYDHLADDLGYASLKPYVRLASAKVCARERDANGVDLFLEEAATELLKVPAEQRPDVLTALVLSSIAEHAVTSPRLQEVYGRVFRKLDLSLNYLISSLVLWSEPQALVNQQRDSYNAEEQAEILERCEKNLKRASCLMDGLEGFSAKDLARIRMARGFVAGRGHDYDRQLEHYKAALTLAAAESSAVPVVWETLGQLAWHPAEHMLGKNLVDLFREVLRVKPRRDGEQVTTDLRGVFLVGLIRALPSVAESGIWKIEAFKEGVACFLGSDGSDQDALDLDLRVTAEILVGGLELIEHDVHTPEARELAEKLASVYDRTEMSRFKASSGEQSPADLRSWLQLEISALRIFTMLAWHERLHVIEGQIADLQSELEARDILEADEWRDDSDTNDWME